ncbi:hypothetical protein EMIHUDRAFT_444030, partial [Emiliania huxleyi CCMP1516]|uniref:Uncharacterized protein n=2 Tax=Emiliania huxleyi TaxID=2903 RepID=A0A0D3JJI9_EMIH1
TPPPSAADGGRESTRRGAPLRLSLRAAGRRPRRPLPSGDPTPRRSRARREWRRARDLCSRARRSQWHGIPGSKALSKQRAAPPPAAVLAAAAAAAASAAAAAAAAAAASRLASVTAALHLAAARPSDGAGSSLDGAFCRALAAAPPLAAAPLVAAPSPVNPAASPANPPHHRRHRLARLAGL